MALATAEGNLLFGLLALQNGLIDQGKLVAAFQAWTLDKARALADHLEVRGDIDAEDRAAVAALVKRHLNRHGDNPEQSLAAIKGAGRVCESLARIGDPEVERTLSHVGSRSTQRDDESDPERTSSYSVGAATSDGQRFRILRPHARGGLGSVSVALDNELHREVALKQILDSHADDPVSRQRFLLEAEVTGGLEHPGIVPVYGLGTHPDGRPYYAMRFIRGNTFKVVVDRFHEDSSLRKNPSQRSLVLRMILRRFTDVCNAIEYAHSRGILHRDLKPNNIIVGEHGETLVVDWGLAKAIGNGGDHAEHGGRTLRPVSAADSSETQPGRRPGHACLYEPRTSRRRSRSSGPALGCLQSRSHTLLPADRSAGLRGKPIRCHSARSTWCIPAAARHRPSH